jgi:hypothetical protein
MFDELTVLAAVWLFGAFIFWPIARAIDSTPKPSLRLLKWTFFVQLTLQVLWGIWLVSLWSRDVSQIQHGLIPLYVIGAVGWVAAVPAFLYWFLERRKS